MEKQFFRRSVCYLLIVAFMMSSILTISIQDVTASYVRYVISESLSIRTKASMEGKVVGTYSKGDKVTCYGTSGSWTKVKYNGNYRYISTKYISSKKPDAASTMNTNSGATYTRYVTASTLTIRKKATVNSASLGEYVRGDKVTCYGTSGGWTKVKKGYVSTNFLSKSKPASTSKEPSSSSTYTRYVTASTLTIRKKATVNSASLGEYVRGEKATCYGTSGGWTKVKKNGISGYVSTNFLSTSKPSANTTDKNNVTGTTIANCAQKYIGLRYVWGGESLTKGVDCSGFTKAIYAKYGYSLPHSAKGQRSSGKSVSSSKRKPGDLICYTAKKGVYHVGIYVGNNKVVHASSTKTGVKTSTWNYRTVYCVRRIIN